jgi:2-keto-3-deoxy-L-fuconate dehydrogenase
VLATDINRERLTDLRGELLCTRVLDATDPSAVNMLVNDQAFDVLVNCVGWVHHETIAGTQYDDWQRSFRINVDTAYHTIRAVLPGMLTRRQGSVITIASAASSVGGFPNRVAYGASKAALIGMTKALAADHVKEGVRFNTICPGTIDSPSLNERINAAEDVEIARANFIARQPMGRFGTCDEVAALSAYLAADESAFMTGSILVFDGGSTN